MSSNPVPVFRISWAPLVMLLAAVIAGSCGCGGGSAMPSQSSTTAAAISVSLSQTTATVQGGGSAQFTATVSNDSAGKGVTWTVTCSAAPCGSVSPTTTPSGTATTYTAPGTPATSLTVTLTATSVADTTKTSSVTITVPSAITVSVTPNSATVQVGASSPFTAIVTGDSANKGVTWTISCSATACGSVSPAATASRTAATYTAPSNAPASNLSVTLTATSASDGAKSASATITVPSVVVTIAPSSATVEVGGTAQFTATVSNDPSNGGVNWNVFYVYEKCSYLAGCGAPVYVTCGANGCGTVSPGTSASGAVATYKAPAQYTPPRIFCGGFPNRCAVIGLFVRATSVDDNSAFAQARITIPPISVSVSPISSSVAVNGTQQFTATVTNDGTNSGVTWTLTQNGVACSPACGTLTSSATLSGAPTSYTGPATLPIFPLVTLTAKSVDDTTKSASATIAITTSSGAVCADTGSEALLKGQYAFLLQGTDEADVVVIAGSFTADGTGNVTGGQIDLSHSANVGGLAGVAIESSGSSYSVGADHRGCLMLANANGGTMFFRFAVGSINASNIASKGHIIEFDDSTGGGTRTTGTLRLQDPTSFSAGQFKGTYTFVLRGASSGSGRGVMAGTFTSDGVSTITGGSFDFNDGTTLNSNIAFPAGTPFICCSASGRGTIGTGTLQDNGAAWVPGFVIYMISSGEAFLSGGVLYNPNNNCCAAEVALGLGGGEAFAAAGPFSDASLNGTAVWRYAESGGSLPDNLDIVHLATAKADGAGNLTSTDYQNSGGTFSTTPAAFTYSVAASGRVTFAGASAPPLLMYMYGQNQAVILGTETGIAPASGAVEAQATGPFSTASFNGTFMLGSEIPTANLQGTACNCWDLTFESGVLTADGNGKASGTSDQSGPTGLTANQSLNLTYAIAADGSGNVGTGTTAILISPKKMVFISNTDTNPTITVVEQ